MRTMLFKHGKTCKEDLLFKKWGDLIAENVEDLAKVMTI